MELTFTTPALLFPAISLLLLAYTNRFLTLAGLVRNLHQLNEKKSEEGIKSQILNLKKRIEIIKTMQILGVLSFTLCVCTMLVLFFKLVIVGSILFTISLLLLLWSLFYSLWELRISVDALDVELKNYEEFKQGN